QLQAPMIVEFESGELRERDWDEIADFGRIVHSAKWGDAVRVGLIQHRSLGEGTILRRYYNGVVPDHYRIGLDWRPGLKPNSPLKPTTFELMADQLLGYPIVATRSMWTVYKHLEFDLELAIDTAAPGTIESRLDTVGLPVHSASPLPMYGFGMTWRALRLVDSELSLYGHLNAIQLAGLGGHFGLIGEAQVAGKWLVKGRLELMFLGAHYTWSVFDTGYLIDRWGHIEAERDGAASTLGGRAGFQLEYGQVWIFGAEYADCGQSGRADFSTWLSAPIGRTTLTAMWRQRRVHHRTELFDPSNALAAVSSQIRLTRLFAFAFFLAREWRTTPEANAFEPTTTVGLTLVLGRAQGG
ncbi:MAG: hypothetical protein VYD85_11145, partial [Pseudomonadota bacterium]|nr:hypothetical protein [Pseudomonadota bacterium]